MISQKLHLECIVRPTIRYLWIKSRYDTVHDKEFTEAVKGLVYRWIYRANKQHIQPGLRLVVLETEGTLSTVYYHVQLVTTDNIFGKRIMVPVLTKIPEELAWELEPSIRFNRGPRLWGSTFHECY
jgi:hypothetical protein